jgi:hypothetical protein
VAHQAGAAEDCYAHAGTPEERKDFFFEKKKQKTFIPAAA